MKNSLKIEVFEYILFKYIEWFKEKYDIDYSIDDFNESFDNDFGTLKILKLHFFISAISVGMRSDFDDIDLLNLFDDFRVDVVGQYEFDVNRHIHSKNSNRYIFDHSGMRLKIILGSWFSLKDSFKSIDETYKAIVDVSINALKKEDKLFIYNGSNDLLSLSHSWFSYSMHRLYSKVIGSDFKLNSDIIRTETKIFKSYKW